MTAWGDWDNRMTGMTRMIWVTRMIWITGITGITWNDWGD